MASPFAIFRKNQKAMYALLAILCMVGFSIGGAVDLFSNQSRSGADPVVATAYGKSIRASELQQLLRRRRITIGFFAEAKAAEFNIPQMSQFLTPQFEGMLGPATKEAVVNTWILDERARQMGMVLSDAAVNNFLRRLTDNKVNSSVFADIARRLDVPQPQLFDALRAELMAMQLRNMALGHLATTPAQRWDYYRRQKQRATVEVAALPVEDLIGDVPDAMDEELQAFFDEHKEQEPDPESPTPGFKVPQKADFQVVIARFNDFYDEKAVTDEEIKKHYDEFKDTRYLWEQFDTDEADEPETSPETEKTTDDPEPTDEKPNEDQGDGSRADDKPDAKPADAKPAEKNDKPAGKADGKSQSSLFWRRELLSIVGHPSAVVAGLLAADVESDEKEPAGADEKTSDDSVKAGGKNEPVAGDEATESAEKTAGEKGEGGKTAEKKTKPAKRPALPPQITDEFILHRDIRQGAHPKHAPFWKVEDIIRRELAREMANKKMQGAIDVLRSKMRTFARNMGPDETEQKMPGLDKLAAAQGLTEVDTGLLTARELREKFPDLAEAKGDGPAFVMIAFGGMAKFQSTTVQDIEGNRYLVWKVEEKDAYVPDFADVRSKVLRVWKLVKARDLALKKAKELADEANKAGKPLKEALAGREGLTVKQTPAFSWLTRGSANVDNRTPLRISEVDGVDFAGPNFMREVFNLRVGTSGVAMNEPQTTAYVVRLVSLEPTPERLRNTFMADDYSLYDEVARDDIVEVQRAWMKGIEAEAKLTWKDNEQLER
jgi:hypothetical protein